MMMHVTKHKNCAAYHGNIKPLIKLDISDNPVTPRIHASSELAIAKCIIYGPYLSIQYIQKRVYHIDIMYKIMFVEHKGHVI